MFAREAVARALCRRHADLRTEASGGAGISHTGHAVAPWLALTLVVSGEDIGRAVAGQVSNGVVARRHWLWEG